MDNNYITGTIPIVVFTPPGSRGTLVYKDAMIRASGGEFAEQFDLTNVYLHYTSSVGKADQVILFQASDISHTGTTDATSLVTQRIHGIQLAGDGGLRIRIKGKNTGAAGTKTLSIAYGATTLYSNAFAGADQNHWTMEIIIRNRVYNVQRIYARGQTGTALLGANTTNSATINTNTDLDVVVTATLADAADTLAITFLEITRI